MDKLYINHRNYYKLFKYIDSVDTEIAGYADMILDSGNQTMEMLEPYLPTQRVTPTTVKICPEATNKLYFERRSLNKGNPNIISMSVWWHSHVNMGVFPSGTDEEEFKKDNKSMNIMLIANKKKQSYTQIKFKVNGIFFHQELKLTLKPPSYDFNNIEDEIDKKVISPKISTYYSSDEESFSPSYSVHDYVYDYGSDYGPNHLLPKNSNYEIPRKKRKKREKKNKAQEGLNV